MQEDLYVIATRVQDGKEIYLAIDEGKSLAYDKTYFKWVEDINDAYATFSPSEVEDTARHHFKSYNRWYITSYKASFN